MRKLKITELNRISVEEFKEAEKLPLVVVLDNIRSLHNSRFRIPHFRMLFALNVSICAALRLLHPMPKCTRRLWERNLP